VERRHLRLPLCTQFCPTCRSIYTAFAHFAGQILVKYLWLIPRAGIAYSIPLFATVNGLIAARFMNETTD